MYHTKTTCLHMMYFYMLVQYNHSHPCLHDNDVKPPNFLYEYIENLTATKTLQPTKSTLTTSHATWPISNFDTAIAR